MAIEDVVSAIRQVQPQWQSHERLAPEVYPLWGECWGGPSWPGCLFPELLGQLLPVIFFPYFEEGSFIAFMVHELL